jgi:hypothetical protein
VNTLCNKTGDTIGADYTLSSVDNAVRHTIVEIKQILIVTPGYS